MVMYTLRLHWEPATKHSKNDWQPVELLFAIVVSAYIRLQKLSSIVPTIIIIILITNAMAAPAGVSLALLWYCLSLSLVATQCRL